MECRTVTRVGEFPYKTYYNKLKREKEMREKIKGEREREREREREPL